MRRLCFSVFSVFLIYLLFCSSAFAVDVWRATYSSNPARYASTAVGAADLAVSTFYGSYCPPMELIDDQGTSKRYRWRRPADCSLGGSSHTIWSYFQWTCPEGDEVDPTNGSCIDPPLQCEYPYVLSPDGESCLCPAGTGFHTDITGQCVEMCPGATYNSATDDCDCNPVLAGGVWDFVNQVCECPDGSYELDGACVPDDHDSDGDGLPDAGEPPGCELLADCDGDGVPDGNEPPDCITNPDCDGDGVPDGNEPPGCMQDSDCDNDGIPDGNEPDPSCIRDVDCDDDGVPDGADPAPLDPDRDNDGVPDGVDPDPDDPDNPTPGGDTDTDGDGTPDGVDPDPNDPNNPPPDDPGEGEGEGAGSGNDDTCLVGEFACPPHYQKAGCSCVPDYLYTGPPSCSAGATCNGDPIACAVANYLHKQQCAMEETAADAGGGEPGPGDMPTNTVDVGGLVGSLDGDVVSVAGGCPSPVAIDALGESMQFDYQPACDMAVMLEPVFLAFAGLWGLFVVGRAF